MATGEPILDYHELLTSFLLLEYLSHMGDPRLSAEERLDVQMKLEYYLHRLEMQQPRQAPRMLRLMDAMFSNVELSVKILPAIEWYLEFIASKDSHWHEAVEVRTLVRFWRELAPGRLRDRALQLIILVELGRLSFNEQASIVCDLFRDAPGLDSEGNLTAHGRYIAGILLREALTAPADRPRVPSALYFSLRVLGFCIAPPGERVPERVVEQIFALVGDIGPDLRREWERILVLR